MYKFGPLALLCAQVVVFAKNQVAASPKLAKKTQIVTCMTSKMHLLQTFCFGLQTLISKPIDLGKSYIPQNRALDISK